MEKTWLGSKLKVPDRTSNPSRGMTPGVQFVEETNMDLEKAPDDGIYVLGEGRFQVNKGDSIPEGGKFERLDPEEQKKRDERIESAKGYTYETTAGQGPAETEGQAGRPTAAAPEAARDQKKL
jgi:hypothetical protein